MDPNAASELPPPRLIEDGRALEELLQAIDGETEIAVDTEANSFFNYRERVCLIQVSAGGSDYLIDPLAGFDLEGVGKLLADESKTKVFHDGEYDVLILKRDFGFEFTSIFDTRVASAALGHKNPGLAAVIREHFGHELDKSLQRSNWGARPLTEQQITYARFDTRFLVALMHELKAELEERGRSMIVDGECRRLEALEPTAAVFRPEEFVRIKGVRALHPKAQRSLRELFVARNELAREADLPPFKVITNPTLMNIAKAGPRNTDELMRVHGFSHRQAKYHGAAVLDALDRARDSGPMGKLPILPRRDGTSEFTNDEVELHESLKRWRTKRSQNEDIDASLILNRRVLLRLAQERPSSIEALERVEGVQAWQVESFGKEILGVLRS